MPQLPIDEKEHVRFLLYNCTNIRVTATNENSIRKCNPNVTRCHNKDSLFYEICHAYKGPVDEFANIHCLLCSEPDIDLYKMGTLSASTCPAKDTTTHKDSERKFPRASWWMLISFNRWDLMDIKLCESGEYYSSGNNCVRFQCVTGYQVVDSRCEEITINTETVVVNVDKQGFDTCLWTPHPTLLLISGRFLRSIELNR